VRAVFPEVPRTEAEEIGRAGPTPQELETAKQRAVYSDCYETGSGFECHLPRNLDWRHEAWERLCEARSLVPALRDSPPEELEIWLRHAKRMRAEGRQVTDMIPGLHEDLEAAGFVEPGWWDTLLEDLAGEPEAPAEE